MTKTSNARLFSMLDCGPRGKHCVVSLGSARTTSHHIMSTKNSHINPVADISLVVTLYPQSLTRTSPTTLAGPILHPTMLPCWLVAATAGRAFMDRLHISGIDLGYGVGALAAPSPSPGRELYIKHGLTMVTGQQSGPLFMSWPPFPGTLLYVL
jgi:hypothetical protein